MKCTYAYALKSSKNLINELERIRKIKGIKATIYKREEKEAD